MPRVVELYRILVASPGDCQEERRLIPEIVDDWNSAHALQWSVVLQPVLWETHSRPELGGGPQEVVNRQLLESCDFLVGVFWSRLGTATRKAASGTVEEIEKLRAAGKPTLLYFSNAPLPPDELEPKQYGALQAYKSKVRALGLVFEYRSPEEFRQQFTRHLANLMASELARPVETTIDAAMREIWERTYLGYYLSARGGEAETSICEDVFKAIKPSLDRLEMLTDLRYSIVNRNIDPVDGRPVVKINVDFPSYYERFGD